MKRLLLILSLLTIIVQGQVIKTPFLKCLPPDENNKVGEKIEEINKILLQRRITGQVVSQDTSISLSHQKYKNLSNQIIKLEIQRMYNTEKIISAECKVLYKKVNKIKSVTRKLEFDKSLNLEIMNINVLNEISDDESNPLEVKCISNDAAKLADISTTTFPLLNSSPTVSLVNSSSTLISIPFATIDNNDIFSVDCNLIRSNYDGKSLFALGSAPQISASMITINENLDIVDVATFYYDPKWSRIVYSKRDDDNYFNAKSYGDNPEDPVRFAWVQSICTSPAGNLFVCDRATRKIYKFSYDFANHNLTCIGNESFVAPGHLQAPSDITCYSYKGTTWLLVADAASNSIHIFNPDNGAFAGDIETFSTGTSTNSLNSPTKLITYSDLIAFIGNNNCFYKGTWPGYGNTIIDGKTVYFPDDCLLAGLGVDHNGTFSVCDPAKMAIHRINMAGEYMCSMVFPYPYYPCDMTEALESETKKVMATYVSSVWGENTGLRTFLPGIDILDFRTEYTLDGKTHIFYKLSDPAQVTVQLKRGSDGVIVFNSNHVTSTGSTFEDTFDNNSFAAGSYTFILKCTPYWNSLYGTYGLEKILERQVEFGNVVSVTLSAPQCPEAPNSNLSGSYYKINDNITSNILGIQNTSVKIEAIPPAGFSFFQWADGNSQNPRNYQLNSSTTLSAVFKKPFVSNTQTAFANSSQRKFIRTPDGFYHLVYESMGKIWYERSTDGINWSLANNGKPLNNDYVYIGTSNDVTGTGSYTVAKHPSLDCRQNTVFVVWEEQSGSNYVVRVAGLGNGVLLGRANSIPFTSYGFYSEDIWPQIAIKDDSRAVVAIRRNDANFKGLEVHYLLLSPENGGATEQALGQIPGTNQSTGGFTLATDRSSTDKYHIAWEQGSYWNCSIQYARFNFTYQTGGVYAVSNSSIKESSVKESSFLAGPVNPGYYIMNVLKTVNVSNATSNTANFLPSMIGATDGTARIAFKGYEEYEPEAGDGWYYTLLVNPDNTSWIPYLNRYGGETFSPQISVGSDTYFVGWTEAYGIAYKTICTDASTLRVMEAVQNSSGRDMQINNWGTRFQQFAMGFNSENSTIPYTFKRSDAIGTIVANKKLQIANGRGVYLTKDQQQLFFILGNVNFDGTNINFTAVKDTIRLEENIKKVNSLLETEPFSLKSNSTLSFAVRYGSRDSSVAKNSMKEGQFASFKVELIDDASGLVIGSYLDEKLNKDSMFRFKESAFKVNSKGIGNMLVKLRFSVNENMKSQYTISDLFMGNGISLSKSLKEVEMGLNGSFGVKEYSLSQNYPNPFNPATIISYTLPKASKVSLRVYDILGKEVATLVNGYEEMGRYSVQFNATNLPSGTYIYEIRANDFVKSGKMMLIK